MKLPKDELLVIQEEYLILPSAKGILIKAIIFNQLNNKD